MSGGVDVASALRRDVETISGFGPRSGYDAPAVQRTLDYLASELRSAGYAIEQERFADHVDHVNVIASRAVGDATGILEVGAHFDTVPGSPGADDNASGVSVALALARLLGERHQPPPVRFCFFGREEFDRSGSRTHAARLRHRRDHVRGCIVLEMVGCCRREPDSQRSPVRIPLVLDPPRVGDFLAVVSNFRSAWLARRLARAARVHAPDLPTYVIAHLGGLLRDGLRSDHLAYWERRIPAIMCTDTGNFRNRGYHTPDDVPGGLDYDFMARITTAVLGALDDWE